MKHLIKEISDEAYKSMIEDLLSRHTKFKEKFEPIDDLGPDETYKNKYLRLQNMIRQSQSIMENSNIYNKNLKVENKLRKAINMIIREELNELGPKALQSTANHLGKDTMHNIAKGILTPGNYDQLFDKFRSVIKFEKRNDFSIIAKS